jgi:hypothetical protein
MSGSQKTAGGASPLEDGVFGVAVSSTVMALREMTDGVGTTVEAAAWLDDGYPFQASVVFGGSEK